ncbi:helix-turn-helix domain-containing protein, partial [Azotobacter chroococcum]|nr:helix-turn-helix domain-containing protein [Azotobacter chroococcum]
MEAGARLAEITKKTPKAASKWLNGEAMPGRANMLAIAEKLHVRAQWLQYGEGSMTEAFDHDAMVEAEDRKRERHAKQAETLAVIATPRSLEALQRIAKAAES